MRWGVLDLKDHTGRVVEIHVAPSTGDGQTRTPHTLSPHCVCGPEPMRTHPNAVPVYNHNQEH